MEDCAYSWYCMGFGVDDDSPLGLKPKAAFEEHRPRPLNMQSDYCDEPNVQLAPDELPLIPLAPTHVPNLSLGKGVDSVLMKFGSAPTLAHEAQGSPLSVVTAGVGLLPFADLAPSTKQQMARAPAEAGGTTKRRPNTTSVDMEILAASPYLGYFGQW